VEGFFRDVLEDLIVIMRIIFRSEILHKFDQEEQHESILNDDRREVLF
jgi:hypothetical protein